jgi:arginase family enzyme
MLWLDAHPDLNTPETTRSGSLGGMPVASLAAVNRMIAGAIKGLKARESIR